MAKVEFHFGESFPRVGFIVTNLSAPKWRWCGSTTSGGTAEQWIKQCKQAVKMKRLSLPLLSVQPSEAVSERHCYNLWRRLVLPKGIGNWSLIS